MKESIRRILVFIVIVGAGTLLIFFDLPLLVILPLVVVVGIVLLILTGAIAVADVRKGVSSLFRKKGSGQPVAPPKTEKSVPDAASGPATPEKRRFSFNLPSLIRKKGVGKEKVPVEPKPQKAGVAADSGKKQSRFAISTLFRKRSSSDSSAISADAGKKQPASQVVKKPKTASHLSSLVSSFRAFGSILKNKKKPDPDKLKKIDSMLDLAVQDKVVTPPFSPAPAPARQPPVSGGSPETVAGAGVAGGEASVDDDPFLALSSDELDAGLLDGLDDDDAPAPAPVPVPGAPSPVRTITIPDDTGMAGGEGEGQLPPEVSSAAEDILKANVQEAGELPSLEGLESVDENLGDLDNLSLDSVDLEDDDDEETGQPPVLSPPAAPAPSQVSAPAPSPSEPAAKKRSDQSEMAAFAAASGGDDDMLSSLAADIKTVKKEQDLSLLRELKDFRAPGTTIETELTDLYTTLNAAAEKQKMIRSKMTTTKPQAK